MTAPPWSPWLTESRLAEGWRRPYYLRDERDRMPPHRDGCGCQNCLDKKETTQ